MFSTPNAGLQNVDFSGGLGGYFASQQQMDAEQARALANEHQGLQNIYQGLQNDRYGAETPNFLRQQRGMADKQEAEGYLAQGSKEQHLQEKIATALSGKSKAEVEQAYAQTEQRLQKVNEARALFKNFVGTGKETQVATTLAQQFGLDVNDPKVQAVLSDPAKVETLLDGYSDSYQRVLTQTQKHLQTQDVHNIEGQYGLQKQLLANEGRVEAAAAKPGTSAKMPTMSQMEAEMRKRLAADPEDKEASEWLADLESYKQRTTPGMGAVTIDPKTKKLTTVQGQLGNGQKKPDPLGIR